MIRFTRLKSKNSLLKILYGFINIIIGLLVGILNMFISFGLWFYKKLIKKYKNELLFIALISGVNLYFSILGLMGKQKEQLYTWLGNSPSFAQIGLIIVFSIILIVGLALYILSRVKKINISDKYFWLIRSVSYFVSFALLMFIVDFVVLDFISRYKLAIRPNQDTSTYDTIIYFVKNYRVSFMEGIKTTLSLALLGTLIGLVLAFGMVILRMLKVGPRDNDFVKLLKKIGNTFANIYVTIIRGTPMVVQAFIFYYLVLSIVRPTMSISEYRDFIDNVWTPFRAGLFTVSINTTAYLTEVLRGGIGSIDKGQEEAASSLGLGKFKTMLLIIFPQGIKNSLPSIVNEFIINIKDTSVLTLIGVLDLFSVGKNDILGVFSGNSLEVYLIVAAYYLILTYLTSKLLQYFEKKMNMPVKGITSSN